MKCSICKHGLLENGFTTVTMENDTSTIVFKHVPALICDNCAEAYLDQSTTQKLLEDATNISKSGVEVDIRQYIQAA